MTFGRLLVLVVMVLVGWCATAVGQVVVIAHRGEHLRHPENTLPAFEEAIRVGADFFELDVRTSADGKLVLSHDATVDRRTNGHGEVAKLTFAELRGLDAGAGARMPTFDEALALAAGSTTIGVYVDVKSATAADVVSAIERRQMTERVVIYCGVPLAREILALNSKLKVMPEARSVENARMLMERLQVKVVAFDAGDFTRDIVAVVKQRGGRIYVDRLGAEADQPAAWQAAIEAGADGIQTDHPGELVEYLRGKGLHR